MELTTVRTVARQLLNDHGLTHWRFDFDRSVSRRGACHYKDQKITLSHSLTLVAGEAEVISTILHEIAHALTPGHDHDNVWRVKFLSIGGNGQRCSTRENEIDRPIEVHCRTHGLTSKRHRKIDLSKYCCLKCGKGTRTLYMKDTRTGQYIYA